jgi:hypothetical protein
VWRGAVLGLKKEKGKDEKMSLRMIHDDIRNSRAHNAQGSPSLVLINRHLSGLHSSWLYGLSVSDMDVMCEYVEVSDRNDRHRCMCKSVSSGMGDVPSIE